MLLATFILAQTTEPAADGPLAGLANYKFADYVFSVLGNLLSSAITAAFIVSGLALLYLQKKFERLQADKDTHVAYAVAQHRRKEQTLTDFTDGIPQNLSMVFEIFTKRSFLRRMARVKLEERERYLDGRSYKQISMAYERDVRVWLTQCQHFTSLTTQVRSRFDSAEIHASVDRVRELFEALVELTPAVAVVRNVADTVEQIALRGHFGDSVREDLHAIREGLDASAAKVPPEPFDRVSSNRTARVLATWIDKLFIACVEQMSAELRQLPVAGLKGESRKWRRQVERGMRVDQQAEQLMAQQGASMHERKQKLLSVAWLAAGLVSLTSIVGCTNYGGSVPIDEDAGMKGSPRQRDATNQSVPIDDDAGMQKPMAPKP